MMKEPIYSEKINMKYKDSMILPRAKESGPQERGIETRKQNRDQRGSSIQTLEQDLLLKSSKQKIDKEKTVQEIELMNEPIIAWLEVLENLAQEGGDDPQLEGETPECVNWWSCECCHTADLIDWDGNSLNQAIARAMKDLIVDNDETTELKLKEEIAQKTSEEDGSNHQLRDELNAKPKKVEELPGIEARHKYSLQNISDLERQLAHPDADPVVAKTEQGEDLEDLFSDQDYIECLGEIPPLIETRKWRALLDTLKMCMQLGINQKAVLEHSKDDKSWTDLEVVEEASKSSINFWHEDLETQTIPESLVGQGGLAKVAYKKMGSPYDGRKYVEEVENSGPLLDELDVEKEDRVSPVNRVTQ